MLVKAKKISYVQRTPEGGVIQAKASGMIPGIFSPPESSEEPISPSDPRIVKVKRLSPEAMLPQRATSFSAGADLHALLKEPVVIQPGETVKIGTGLAVETPVGYAAFLYGRSGLGVKHGIAPANCVGVCDADYRGEIQIGLHNRSSVPFTVQPFDRIAQMVIAPVFDAIFVDAEELSDTERGTGGFGSTGVAGQTAFGTEGKKETI